MDVALPWVVARDGQWHHLEVTASAVYIDGVRQD